MEDCAAFVSLDSWHPYVIPRFVVDLYYSTNIQRQLVAVNRSCGRLTVQSRILGCQTNVIWHSSTVIDDVTKYCQKNRSYTLVYFYIDFNDPKKQQSAYLIRSLLTQLSFILPQAIDILEKLHAECNDGKRQPAPVDLLNAFKTILGYCDHTYLVVDALDECSDHEDLLEVIAEIISWKLDKLHVIATSRRERRIEDGLTDLVSVQIGLDIDLVDADIQTYLTAKLRVDTRFRKWTKEEQLEIKNTLMSGARGM